MPFILTNTQKGSLFGAWDESQDLSEEFAWGFFTVGHLGEENPKVGQIRPREGEVWRQYLPVMIWLSVGG
jgi:hypothetical protein